MAGMMAGGWLAGGWLVAGGTFGQLGSTLVHLDTPMHVLDGCPVLRELLRSTLSARKLLHTL